MRMGNASPGPTFRLGTDTDALPPTVTSCETTRSATPRILFAVALRSVRDMCRSSTRAAPRGVARDSPIDADSSVTGESGGTLNLTALCESSGTSWAASPAALHKARMASRCRDLFHINVIDRYVAGFRIHVASPHGTLRAHRVSHILGARMHQLQSLSALA